MAAKTQQKLVWWTLWHHGDGLDIDADNLLHLYATKKEAMRAASDFSPDSEGRLPVPMKIRIELNVE